MKNVKFLMSFVLVSFVAQGAFMNARADLPMLDTACQKPTDWVNKETVIKDAPTWKDLIDPNAAWGVDLKKVYDRQEKNRRSDKLVGTDPSVTIANITSSKDRLKAYYEINIPYEIKKSKLEGELAKLNKKIIKGKETKEKIHQLQHELDEATKERNKLLGEKNISTSFDPEQMKIVIKELQGRALADLGQYGLTCQQILVLPSRELGEKVSNWSSSDK